MKHLREYLFPKLDALSGIIRERVNHFDYAVQNRAWALSERSPTWVIRRAVDNSLRIDLGAP